MAAEKQRRGIETDSTEQANTLIVGTSEGSGMDKLKDQAVAKDERLVSSIMSTEANGTGISREAARQSQPLDMGREYNSFYHPNIYAPPAQSIFYGGYQNVASGWDDYSRYVNSEALELSSQGIYGDNSSLLFHSGYGYNPQVPYGPYSPVTTPVSSLGGDQQIYSPQQFSLTGPYYHQPVPPTMPYLSSPPVSQSEHPIPLAIDQRGFDGLVSGASASEWSKLPDGYRASTFWPSLPSSPQPLRAGGPFNHTAAPLTAGMQQRPTYGFGSTTSSYDRGFSHLGMYQGVNFNGSFSGSNVGNQNWVAVDKTRRKRGNAALFSCNGTLDALDEQSKGPRASKLRNRTPVCSSSSDKANESRANDLYNRADFITDYKDAKFFVIKSYSEDNVHKSIKYGVWASTANGNRRLDAAFQEAIEKNPPTPVFLFFSVNASGQFLGVAEMTGPVDFDRSVSYWQQDKWSGQFPVKWHVLKDVPNSQFRHIILDNNDNKPVTNSRDTQEVKLEKGLEMLCIFKGYESNQSILDDFEYYEDRQNIMEERKAKQEGLIESISTACEQQAEITEDLVEDISESFGQAVKLEENTDADGVLKERDSPASGN